MARHKTKRYMMYGNKQDEYQNNMNKYKRYAVIMAISVCLVFAMYFAFAAPNIESRKMRQNIEWHLEKKKWNVQPLTDSQFGLVKESINLGRLENEYLQKLLVVRTPGSKNIIEVKNYIKRTMKNLGWAVEVDAFKTKPPDPHPETLFSNVIATYNPNTKRRLVLACHYDSKIEPKGFLGAIDSAVPCAMMLEIAKALQSYLAMLPIDSDITLQYIFFDGEEAFEKWTSKDSLYGSRHLATKWNKQEWPKNSNSGKTVLDSMDLLILLDLLGAPNPKFFDYKQVPTRHYKELIRIEENLHDGIKYFHSQISYVGIDDDHMPFLRRNVPVLHFVPSPFPPQWHKITDNKENLDMGTILRLTRIMAAFVAEYLHLEPKVS